MARLAEHLWSSTRLQSLILAGIAAMVCLGPARAQLPTANTSRETTAGSELSGSALIGLRYQSNATAAPTGRVRWGGLPVDLNESYKAAADWNVFAALNALHAWELPQEPGGAWQTRVNGYVARQFERSDVDVSQLSIASGPRLPLLRGHFDELSIRIAAAAEYAMLADRTDYHAYGLSVTVDKQIGRAEILLGLDWRQRYFNDTALYPFNSDASGRELTGSLSWSFVAAQWLTGTFSASYTAVDAHKRWEDYRDLYAGLTLNFYSDFSPFAAGEKSVLVLSGAYFRSVYARPNPLIDPGRSRQDDNFRFSLTGSLPLGRSISLLTQGGYARRDSSLPNFDYDNWFGMTALAWRF